MNKYYTTLEQAQHLVKLGLKTSTADMNYCNYCPKGIGYSDQYRIGIPSYEEEKERVDSLIEKFRGNRKDWAIAWDVQPAWSVGALLDILPITINELYDDDANTYVLREVGRYGIEYTRKYSSDQSDTWGEPEERFIGETLTDACYKALVWCLENGYVKEDFCKKYNQFEGK